MLIAESFLGSFGVDRKGATNLVAEAGGKVSRIDGSAYVPGDVDVVATNGRIHEAVCGFLKVEE